MYVYDTLKEAKKALKENPYLSSDMKIVKVSGGYVIMTWSEYWVWKKQK